MVASIGPMAETNKKIREIKVPEKIFKNEFQKLKISVKSPELKLVQEMVEHMDWDRVSLVVNFRIRDPHTSENQAE